MNYRIQVHGTLPHGDTHLCWESGLADFRALVLPLVCEECGSRYETEEDLDGGASVRPEPPGPVPSWVVKNDEGLYVTESVPGSCYFSPKQRHAKRFTSPVRAAMVALQWGGDGGWIIPKLVPKRSSQLPSDEQVKT